MKVEVEAYWIYRTFCLTNLIVYRYLKTVIIMPYINIDLDDYIDEFDTDELISELDSRKLNDSEKKSLSDILHDNTNNSNFPLLTLIDDVKMDVVRKGLHKKTLQELELFFNN
jgi:hypothetical protein